ncbi:MAG: hypothetical protein MI807_04770 [Verrucomicrobiales bacterium]|nr:hypothetical protein [Verrucomicrobiales bacterium]
MDNPEKNDPVWKLLSHASNVEPGPFFSRNVAREARKMKEKNGLFRETLALFRAPVFATVAVVALLIAVTVVVQKQKTVTAPPAVAASDETGFDPAEELESVEYLGQLMAVTDPAQLSDEALGDLFF